MKFDWSKFDVFDVKKIERHAKIKELLESEAGEKLLEYIAELSLAEIGVLRSDPYQQAFLEGRRSVFVCLLHYVGADAAEYAKRIVDENREKYYYMRRLKEVNDSEIFDK